MPETVKHCPLCTRNQSNIFDQRNFHEYVVVNRLCSSCGLVFQSPRMTDSELAEFYEREYRELYQGQEGPDPKDIAVQQGRAGALLAFVKPHLNQVKRHMDIGSSAGILLKRFHEVYDCSSTGVEPGNAYRTYAQSQGLRVYISLDDLQAGDDRPFDLVSMAHTLEHLPHPVEYLVSLRETLLTPDGWLLIEVPNLYCHESFEVAHLVSYSQHSLTQTLHKSGYRVHTLEQHGRPRSKILPLYLTVLAMPKKDRNAFRLHPEHGVKRKRQLGLLHRRILTRLYPHKAWIRLTVPHQET